MAQQLASSAAGASAAAWRRRRRRRWRCAPAQFYGPIRRDPRTAHPRLSLLPQCRTAATCRDPPAHPPHLVPVRAPCPPAAVAHAPLRPPHIPPRYEERILGASVERTAFDGTPISVTRSYEERMVTATPTRNGWRWRAPRARATPIRDSAVGAPVGAVAPGGGGGGERFGRGGVGRRRLPSMRAKMTSTKDEPGRSAFLDGSMSSTR